MKKLTHTDNHGKAVMVDIGEKIIQARIARASGHMKLAPETIRLIEENQLKKGDVLTVAQVAGINAAKQTSSLIPLCHNISIESVSVSLAIDKTGVKAVSEVKCTGKTEWRWKHLYLFQLRFLPYMICARRWIRI